VQTGRERKPDTGIQLDLTACLEVLPGGQRWALHPGVVTIGRGSGCDISLDAPVIKEKKLVSNLHAHLNCQGESYRLFDGAPDGKPSRNGTYVNLRRLPQGGVELKDGDLILLAALDPEHPDPDGPGVASLCFHKVRR
jgi:predicted component of type VI protein secretion system